MAVDTSCIVACHQVQLRIVAMRFVRALPGIIANVVFNRALFDRISIAPKSLGGLTPRFPCNSPGAPHTTIGLTWRVVLAFCATIQKKWHIRLAPRSPDFRCGFMPLGTLRPFGRSSRMPLCGCRRRVHHARRNGCARIHFARMPDCLVPRATSHSIRIALKHLTKGARHYYVR